MSVNDTHRVSEPSQSAREHLSHAPPLLPQMATILRSSVIRVRSDCFELYVNVIKEDVFFCAQLLLLIIMFGGGTRVVCSCRGCCTVRRN